VTKPNLRRAGLVQAAQKRSARRRKRPRRPMRGLPPHQDGSRRVRIEGLPALDMIDTMDDATSEVCSMFLVAEEGTAPRDAGSPGGTARGIQLGNLFETFLMLSLRGSQRSNGKP
jgi:hypothetical protein